MTRPTLDALLDTLVQEGARIIEAPLPPNMWGATSWRSGVVYLQRGMSDRQALPVVSHEIQHWRAQHEGHQSQRIEEMIRRRVAAQIIDMDDYARAERMYGCCPAKLAVELDTTVPVVEAFQRTLAAVPANMLRAMPPARSMRAWAG